MKKVGDCGLGQRVAQSTRLEDYCSAPDSEEVEEEADPLVQVEDPEPGSAATIWLVCDLGPHAELGAHSRHLMTTA